MDASPSTDNRLAGVVIGGNVPVTVHAYRYLTSPAVAASGASVFLEYYRWLNSDFAPYMQNIVEVFDGSKWERVWETEGSPGITDSSWVKQSFDITQHANAQLRVRFGYQVGATNAFTVSGWNVDDVKVIAVNLGVQLVCVTDRDLIALQRYRRVAILALHATATQQFHLATRVVHGNETTPSLGLEAGSIRRGPLHDQGPRLAFLNRALRLFVRWQLRQGRWSAHAANSEHRDAGRQHRKRQCSGRVGRNAAHEMAYIRHSTTSAPLAPPLSIPLGEARCANSTPAN